jgi:hypothetical protein
MNTQSKIMSSLQNVETNDIVFAAVLKVKGYRLDSIEKDGRKGIFMFSNVEVSVVTEFNLGQTMVEPVAFNNAVRTLTTAAKRIL